MVLSNVIDHFIIFFVFSFPGFAYRVVPGPGREEVGEEPPLPFRLLSRLRTGVDAVRSIIDRARADGQQMLGNAIAQQQAGEDAAAAGFFPGGGRAFPAASYPPSPSQPQQMQMQQAAGSSGRGAVPPQAWGSGSYQQPQRPPYASMFDASSMESQRQFDWGRGAEEGQEGGGAASPVVTGAARIWGRIRSLLAPLSEAERRAEGSLLGPPPGPPLHFYPASGAAEAPLGRAAPVEFPMGRPDVASGRYSVGMEYPAQPGQEQQGQQFGAGGAFNVDRYPDTSRAAPSDALPPGAWPSQPRPEAFQQPPPGTGAPPQEQQSAAQSAAQPSMDGPAATGPKIFIHGSDIVFIPNPAEFQR
jgi:hypothetical protein